MRGLSLGAAGLAITVAIAHVGDRRAVAVEPRRASGRSRGSWASARCCCSSGQVAVASTLWLQVPLAVAYVGWGVVGLGMGIAFATIPLAAMRVSGSGEEERGAVVGAADGHARRGDRRRARRCRDRGLSDALDAPLRTGIAGAFALALVTALALAAITPRIPSGAVDASRLRRVKPPARVGVQLPEVEREVRWPEYVAMARAAERVGFDSVWVGDHLLYRGDGRPERGPWEAWTTLAAIAAGDRARRARPARRVRRVPRTRDAREAGGHGATRSPAAGSCSRSGAGWNETEFRAFGFPFDRRASRFEESFEVIRRLVAGERVTVHGEHVQVDDAVLLPAPARAPRLMIGSTGHRVLTAALPHVDAWNTWFDWYGNSPEGFAARIGRDRRRRPSVGRDPGEIERSACLLVALDPSTQERPADPRAPPVTGPPAAIAEAIEAMARRRRR